MMIYLEWFTFPDSEKEFDFFLKQKRTCYDSYYPFQILSRHHFRSPFSMVEMGPEKRQRLMSLRKN